MREVNKIDIDITNLKSREIIKILELYSHGSLAIKYERVFWCSDYAEPETRENPVGTPPGVPPNQKRRNPGEPFQRMADSLGSMICMPR
ncbi:MAG: hypothetical protein M0R17_09430 [Candidatus Omnitrophica bacterium]|nr:hypothetical protein [Candidatus Omnitrophota bacterium]